MLYKYAAIKVQQTDLDKPILLFGASVLEIDKWSGVPQKKKFEEGAETTGFQREFNKKRLEDLSQFFSNKENVIQNPLLCATRSTTGGNVRFIDSPANDESVYDSDHFTIGTVEIEINDFSTLSLTDIFGDLRNQLESRMPELADDDVPSALLDSLKQDIGLTENALDDEEMMSSEQDTETDIEGVLFEESHIADFWAHIAARHEILKELGSTAPQDEILGFSRDSMLSFLKPVVLVDGQHRLVGSLAALDTQMESAECQEMIIEMLDDTDSTPDAITLDIQTTLSRRLPVSLLMTESPAEQVFQFVVVNQKATPIGKPLLGTIVSTTLTNEEMSEVADRLRKAGVDLEEAQAITWLARNPGSPFFNKVERGLTSDAKDLMQWTVLGGLVRVFRELAGGVLFGQANDYAAIWRHKYLSDSAIVSTFEAEGFESAFDYWSALDGPWRDVFCGFFTCIKDKFGEVELEEKANYWGKPRSSNLFNKISLTILAADFFQALVEMKRKIDSVEDIDDLVESWLEDVNLHYFDRDWKLSGVKKDSVGIRNQWAQLWWEYRKNPTNLPDYRQYRKVRQI